MWKNIDTIITIFLIERSFHEAPCLYLVRAIDTVLYKRRVDYGILRKCCMGSYINGEKISQKTVIYRTCAEDECKSDLYLLLEFGTNVFSNYTKIKYEFSLHPVYTSVRSETNEYVWSLFFQKICRQKICRNDNIYIYFLCLFCELKDHELITICLREIKIYGISLWKFITYILERLLFTYLYLFIQ